MLIEYSTRYVLLNMTTSSHCTVTIAFSGASDEHSRIIYSNYGNDIVTTIG